MWINKNCLWTLTRLEEWDARPLPRANTDSFLEESWHVHVLPPRQHRFLGHERIRTFLRYCSRFTSGSAFFSITYIVRREKGPQKDSIGIGWQFNPLFEGIFLKKYEVDLQEKKITRETFHNIWKHKCQENHWVLFQCVWIFKIHIIIHHGNTSGYERDKLWQSSKQVYHERMD